MCDSVNIILCSLCNFCYNILCVAILPQISLKMKTSKINKFLHHFCKWVEPKSAHAIRQAFWLNDGSSSSTITLSFMIFCMVTCIHHNTKVLLNFSHNTKQFNTFPCFCSKHKYYIYYMYYNCNALFHLSVSSGKKVKFFPVPSHNKTQTIYHDDTTRHIVYIYTC